jgi:hypothetical protein
MKLKNMNVKLKVVVFCDEGSDDWNQYFKTEFDNANITFSDIKIFDNPNAFTESFDIFMFDWGGMSLGNSMLDHFIRYLYKMANDNPNKDFVLLSRFTERAYEDYERDSNGELENIYNTERFIDKLLNEPEYYENNN